MRLDSTGNVGIGTTESWSNYYNFQQITQDVTAYSSTADTDGQIASRSIRFIYLTQPIPTQVIGKGQMAYLECVALNLSVELRSATGGSGPNEL